MEWKKFGRVRAIGLEDRYLFARQLHVLQRAGVPLLSSLRALEEQLPSGHFREIIALVGRDLTNGHTLSQAFARHSQAFDPVFVSLIKVGESGGLLEDVLKRIADLTLWEMDLRAKIMQALQYPLIVVGTLIAALSMMMIFVLPRFAGFFQSLKISLPLQTRLVIGLGQIMGRYGLLFFLFFLAGGILVWRVLRTESGKLWWHQKVLHLPILGSLFVQLMMSRFARTVSALTASGTPILDTLQLAGESLNNKHIERGLIQVQERVRGGETLARAIASIHLFPPIVVQMVSTGEETGRLDEMLHSVADYYDQQATYLVRKLVTYVEPALLIVVGVGVLLMATAVLVPMWDMVKLFKQ